MTALRANRRRIVLAAIFLVAGLLLVAPGPAAAQSLCGNQECAFVFCYPVGDENVCRAAWVGCYSPQPCAGCCMCPIPGGTCKDVQRALTDNENPTDDVLISQGTLVCHELIRERLKVERGVRLFDDNSSWASISEPDRVKVTGSAYPDGVQEPKDGTGAGGFVPTKEQAPPRAFTCEVQRNFKGEWMPVTLTISEPEK